LVERKSLLDVQAAGKGKAPNCSFPFTARYFAAILPSFLSVRGCTSPEIQAILLGFICFYLFLLAGPAEPAAWRVICWLKAWATAVPSNRVALYAL
jgi:hypothetical protein